MDLKHLGDALDHWKGSLIELLGEKNLGVVRNLQLVPMLTDQKPWTQQNLETYAKLLRRETNNIFRKDEPFSHSKNAPDSYLRNLGENDLFFDRDTGIAPDQNATIKHVKPSEVAWILGEAPTRMRMIYQHKWQRNKMTDTPKRVLLIEGLREFHGFAYNADAVAMVLIPCDQVRVAKASQRIRDWLGPIASGRIIQ